MKQKYGIDSMPETAENVAGDYGVSRADQDAFALRSQQRAAAAIKAGRFAQEITPVHVPQKKGDHDRRRARRASARDHARAAREAQGRSCARTASVTAGNASGVNDGAAALLLASEAAAKRHGLKPRARVLGMATAGVPPRVMGIGPAPATERLLALLGMKIDQFDVIELNEAFAAQALAVLRMLKRARRRGERESERRGDRARPSARRVRCAARDDGAVRARADRRPLRTCDDVHRRRAGDRAGDRAGVAGARAEASGRRCPNCWRGAFASGRSSGRHRRADRHCRR